MDLVQSVLVHISASESELNPPAHVHMVTDNVLQSVERQHKQVNMRSADRHLIPATPAKHCVPLIAEHLKRVVFCHSSFIS